MKKIAVIELDVLSVKMTIASVVKQNSVVILEQIKEPINFTSDIEDGGIIKATKINEFIKICQSFKSILNSHEVVETVCLAHRKFYDVKNEVSFFEQVYNKCDLKFSEMTVEEEVNAFYYAVINSIDVSRGVLFVVNTNDTVILNFSKRNIFEKNIIPFGTLNVLKEAKAENLSPKETCEKVSTFFTKELEKIEWLKTVDEDASVIGMENAFLNICKLSRKITKYPLDIENNYVLSKEGFNATYEFIKGLDLDKSTKIKGINTDKPELFISAFGIYSAIYSYLKVNNIIASKLALSEGQLFYMANPSLTEKPYPDILGNYLSTLNEYFPTMPAQNEHVYNFSIVLYKQLKVLHKLPRTYVKALRIASNLYSCGNRVSFYENNRAAYQVVLHSNILGTSHRDILLAAFTLLCFNLDDFNLAEWVKYKSILTEEDIDDVKKLSTLIRLAIALDRFGKKKINDITCDLLGDSIIIKTQTESNAELELREGMKLESDFKKVFKKNLELL